MTCLIVFDDDGPGPHAPALYAAGYFERAGGNAANSIAKWNGQSWSALGDGLRGGQIPVATVYSLGVYNDGSGPALYASGQFQFAGGALAAGLARWNGTAWSTNFGATFNNEVVYAMQVFDDGSGPALYLTGQGGDNNLMRNGIARWNGVTWSMPSTSPSPMPGGTPGRALAVYDSGSGPGLYVGGSFPVIGGQTVNRIARYGRPMCPANCDGSFNAAGCPTLNVNDFNCMINRFANGDLRANCDGSTVSPVLTCNDFMCFLNKYAAGCS